MSSQISTWKVTGTVPVERNSMSVPNGTCWPASVIVLLDHVGARHEMALLVEFAVVRQVGLGHDAQDHAAMDDDGGVVEPAGHAQRGADDQDGEELVGRLDHLGDRPLDLVEQRILQQQVLDGVGRQPELRENHDGGAGLVALAGQPQRLRKIVGGVGDPGPRDAARNTHEFV